MMRRVELGARVVLGLVNVQNDARPRRDGGRERLMIVDPQIALEPNEDAVNLPATSVV
jgi:hypothetical protein